MSVDRGAGRTWQARALLAIFALNAAAVVLLWWMGSGGGTEPADRLNAAGRITGLLGTYLVLVQLVLRTHVPWLVAAFGKDALKRAHTWNACVAFALLAAHGLLQLVGYALEDRVDVLVELGRMALHYEGVLLGIASLVLFGALMAVSLPAIRHRIAWPAWRAMHLYTYLAVALSVPHQIPTGRDFVDAPVAVAYWTGLYVAVVAILASARVPALWRNARAALSGGVRTWPRTAAFAVAGTVLSVYLLASVQVTPASIDVPEAAAPPEREPALSAPPPSAPSNASVPVPASTTSGEFLGEVIDTQYGDAQVRIVVAGGRLVDVAWETRPSASRRSRQISDAVEQWLVARAIRAQSARIDVISGATYTSEGFKASLATALAAAGLTPSGSDEKP